MANRIIAYPNCSKGGVSTVIRNRALNAPSDTFFAIFTTDRGGKFAYSDLPNVQVRIIEVGQLTEYIKYLIDSLEIDEVSILNFPKEANAIGSQREVQLTYEFHTSDIPWIQRDLSVLNLEVIDQLVVPSWQMYDTLEHTLDGEIFEKITVRPNELNEITFSKDGAIANLPYPGRPEMVPLIWIGRLEWLKGDVDFVRVLSQTPETFFGLMVISLEDNAVRVGNLIREANALGVSQRLFFIMDISQDEVASIFRAAAERGGWFVSTSYIESFGYAVFEALACGIKVAGYKPKVPVWDELTPEDGAHFVELGDVEAIANTVTR